MHYYLPSLCYPFLPLSPPFFTLVILFIPSLAPPPFFYIGFSLDIFDFGQYERVRTIPCCRYLFLPLLSPPLSSSPFISSPPPSSYSIEQVHFQFPVTYPATAPHISFVDSFKCTVGICFYFLFIVYFHFFFFTRRNTVI